MQCHFVGHECILMSYNMAAALLTIQLICKWRHCHCVYSYSYLTYLLTYWVTHWMVWFVLPGDVIGKHHINEAVSPAAVLLPPSDVTEKTASCGGDDAFMASYQLQQQYNYKSNYTPWPPPLQVMSDHKASCHCKTSANRRNTKHRRDRDRDWVILHHYHILCWVCSCKHRPFAFPGWVS